MTRKNLLFLSMIVVGVGASTAPVSAQMESDPEKFYRAPNTIHGKAVVIPMGAHFEGRMNDTISSKTKPGTKFSIEITSPVLANATDVLIPIGSKIIGEVVEAIPSGKQPRTKNQWNQKNPKPTGKLRTQLSAITTPDGMTYPLVATIMHDYVKNGAYDRPNKELGTPNMGYVGSQSSFDAVQPGIDTRPGGNHTPKVMTRREFERDPIMGTGGPKSSVYGTPIIRSVRKLNHELVISSGSPLTVHLDAPLKMSIAPAQGALSIDLDPTQPPLDEETRGQSNFRRFQPANRRGQQEEEEQQEPPPQAISPPQQPSAPDPEEGIPAFLRRKKSYSSNNNNSGFASPQQQQAQPAQVGSPQPSQRPGEAF